MAQDKAINIELGRHAVALAKQEGGDGALRSIEGHLSGLVSDPEERCLVSGQWFVISVEPRQGLLAKGELSSFGLVPYCPMVPRRERHGRGAERTSFRPMFGCYMFVKCQPANDHWNLVTKARGVRRLLGKDGRPKPVDDGQIEVIRLIEAEEFEQEEHRSLIEEAAKIAKLKGRSGIVWHFSAGDVVRIKNGPFAAFHAQLESAVDCHDRISALVSLFGRASLVELSAFDIEAL